MATRHMIAICTLAAALPQLGVATVRAAPFGLQATVPQILADASTSWPAAARSAGPWEAAGCLVRHGAQLLMVKDVWSRRWSLPGGSIEAGETPANAAVREVFEKTGLRVTVHAPPVATLAGAFAAFTCTVDGGTVMLAGENLALPDASRREIAEAQFVDPATLPPAKWRFMSQRESIVALRDAGGSGLPLLHTVAMPAAGPIMARELGWSRWVQAHGGAAAETLAGWASWLGESPFLLLVVAWVWCRRGWRLAAELFFFVVLSVFVGCLAKQAMPLPRPCYLDPLLQKEHVASFGFPSGHTLEFTSILGFLLKRLPALRRTALMLCGAFVCGYGRVYLGAHFVHDVVGGWALAACTTAVYVACLHRVQGAYLLPWHWFAAAVALAGATLVVQPMPTPTFYTAALLGFSCGLLLTKAWRIAPRRWQQGLQFVLMLSLMMLVQRWWVWPLAPDALLRTCLWRLCAKAYVMGLAVPLSARVARACVGLLGAQPELS